VKGRFSSGIARWLTIVTICIGLPAHAQTVCMNWDSFMNVIKAKAGSRIIARGKVSDKSNVYMILTGRPDGEFFIVSVEGNVACLLVYGTEGVRLNSMTGKDT